MKTLTALVSAYVRSRRRRSNLNTLGGLLGLLVVMIVVYSAAFHWLMAYEGQQHSWLTGFYWTMVSMSTLGFGDITFSSDAGRMFSVLVLTTGTIYLLILLPFTFIQFFYAPWLEARDEARAPRALPEDIAGHVLLTSYGAIETALIHRLTQFGTGYCVIVPESAEAIALFDKGVRVMVGTHDDPATYQRARLERAAMLVTLGADTASTNVAMTAREVSADVPIVARAHVPAAVDILKLAGCDLVLQLDDLLGRMMARRVFARTGRTHFIGEIDGLCIAEAAAVGTPLVGHTLRDLRLRERFNVTVGGVWERGHYTLGGPDTEVSADAVLLLAGTREQLEAYDREFGREGATEVSAVIIGGGRVGRAVARALREQGVEHRVIEKFAARVPAGDSRTVVGDAADFDVLERAGIERASAVIVTTHEDDMNVYLTLYCRRLRPDVLILSRATLERNSVTLHRAGADVVLSYSAMGANAIVNRLRDSSLLLVAEGLDVATVPVPASLVGKTLQQSRIRLDTGISVLAIRQDGVMQINPDVDVPIPAAAELVLLGDREAEARFFQKYR
ncbi:MAG: potassium transporter TrkA [Acidobacteria bacterium SCN 69-37]|nr:MAG: potassium transporter TrkA [Acidobacteria bacterium SCN 69-37]